jgi:phospholipase/carboxylesterase
LDDFRLDDLVALIPPLLGALEALGFIARYANPFDVQAALDAVGAPDVALAAERPRLEAWSDEPGGVRRALEAASDAVLEGFALLREAAQQPGEARSFYRALGRATRAQEALYPLAAHLPPVSRHFLDPALRGDEGLRARLARADVPDGTGLIGGDSDPGARGGYAAYVPEYYAPDASWPLVMALHGGAGNGRSFLWSWLREARSWGAIVIAPTALGDTWALMGPDIDTPNLLSILDQARTRWRIDSKRLLLAGMSDGGTFAYVSGLLEESPFTHLAPTAASFHAFLAEAAEERRLAGLPIHITHGALDWMFPVEVARHARDVLTLAGANVTYRELADLGHAYPRELNQSILRWLEKTA